jgi:hypothetical protein
MCGCARHGMSWRPRTLTIAHRRDRILVPVKIRPDVGSSLAAGFANEPPFQIGEPDVIRPLVCADGPGVTALIIRAIDQDSAHASGAHFCKGYLHRMGRGRHAA